MTALIVILLSSLKIGLSTFGHYDFQSDQFTGILKPSVNVNLFRGNFRLYLDFSFNIVKTQDSIHKESKLYQCYLKYQRDNLEIKGGKILFIPGFAGLFNPFFLKPAFETIETDVEGEKGIFLRLVNEIAIPSLFFTFHDKYRTLKIQLSRSLTKFEVGIYSEILRTSNIGNSKIGAYLGYFEKHTLKIQGFLKDSILNASFSLEFPVKSTILNLSYLHRGQPEITIIPSTYILTKNLIALEIKFPEKIFEIPYFLTFYDLDNRALTSLFDYRYTISNNFLLEAGFILCQCRNALNYSIYGGFKFTKGF